MRASMQEKAVCSSGFPVSKSGMPARELGTRNRLFLAFIILLSASFAGQSWSLLTFGPIESNLVFFGDKVVAASYDGFIYCAYQQNGIISWRTYVEEKIKELESPGSQIVGISNSRIVILDRSGNIQHKVNETTIYGMAASPEFIYISTDKGVKKYDYEGTLLWVIHENDMPLTDILLLNDTLIYGASDELVVADINGSVRSRTRVSPFWESRPEFHLGVVYIGSNDGKMNAVNIYTGKILWTFDTGGWIMSDPIYSNDVVYFGSNDGYIYAVNSKNGTLIWKRKTAEAVQGSMVITSLGGREMLITGSNDNKIYIVDTKNGNVVIAFSAHGWVHNPAFYGGMLYFGSYDGLIYSYVVDRGCTIDSPFTGESIGYKVVNVSGRVFSQYPGAQVAVRVNNGTWNMAQVSGNDWFYIFDPNNYEFGNVFVECRVSDSAGQESKGFTYVVLFRDQNAQKFVMIVDAPRSVTEDKNFTISVLDENGQRMDDFTVSAAGKTYAGKNGTVTLRFAEPGTYTLTVKKTGYEDGRVTVNVSYDMTVLATYAGVAFAVLAVAFYLFVYKRRR